MINDVVQGPQRGTAVCQLHMRELGAFGPVTAVRQAVASYPSMAFPCSREDRDFASKRISQLLRQNDPLQLLAGWSLAVADAVAERPGKSLTFSPTLGTLADYIPEALLSKFGPILLSTETLEEDPRLMIDYVNCVALRHACAGTQYDAAALYLLAKAMTDRHFLCQRSPDEKCSPISTLQRFMSKPDYSGRSLRTGVLAILHSGLAQTRSSEEGE